MPNPETPESEKETYYKVTRMKRSEIAKEIENEDVKAKKMKEDLARREFYENILYFIMFGLLAMLVFIIFFGPVWEW